MIPRTFLTGLIAGAIGGMATLYGFVFALMVLRDHLAGRCTAFTCSTWWHDHDGEDEYAG